VVRKLRKSEHASGIFLLALTMLTFGARKPRWHMQELGLVIASTCLLTLLPKEIARSIVLLPSDTMLDVYTLMRGQTRHFIKAARIVRNEYREFVLTKGTQVPSVAYDAWIKRNINRIIIKDCGMINSRPLCIAGLSKCLAWELLGNIYVTVRKKIRTLEIAIVRPALNAKIALITAVETAKVRGVAMGSPMVIAAISAAKMGAAAAQSAFKKNAAKAKAEFARNAPFMSRAEKRAIQSKATREAAAKYRKDRNEKAERRQAANRAEPKGPTFY